MGDACREMPRYKCHKEVWALKIKEVSVIPASPCVHRYGATTCGYGPDECMHLGSGLPIPPNGQHRYEPADGLLPVGAAMITPEDPGYAPFSIDAAYLRKHNPQAGGYYVVYADGYKSFSPAEPFEDGYTRIE